MMRLTHEGEAEGFEGLKGWAKRAFERNGFADLYAREVERTFAMLTVHAMQNGNKTQQNKIRDSIDECQKFIADMQADWAKRTVRFAVGEEQSVTGETIQVQYGTDPRDEARAFYNCLKGIKDILTVDSRVVEGQYRVLSESALSPNL